MTYEAEVVMIPTVPRSVNRIGIRGSCEYCALEEDFAYLEKSMMLIVRGAHTPVTADMQLSHSHAFVGPETVAGRLSNSPPPPAL